MQMMHMAAAGKAHSKRLMLDIGSTSGIGSTAFRLSRHYGQGLPIIADPWSGEAGLHGNFGCRMFKGSLHVPSVRTPVRREKQVRLDEPDRVQPGVTGRPSG